MSRTASAVLALAIVGVTASCAARRFQPPSGPGDAAPGAGDAWAQATTACRTVEAFAPTLRLSGRVEGQRLRGVQIQAALTKAGAIRLEAAAYGRRVFDFAGTSDQSTLFLPGENEVVRGRPDEIVEALIGIRLGSQRLLALLTGCVEPGTSTYVATRHGELLAFTIEDGRRVFLKNENRWRAVAGEAPGFVVEYRRYAGDWPAEIRLWSDASTPARAEITFKLDPPIVNPSLSQATFEVKVPPGASELTLDELKAKLRR